MDEGGFFQGGVEGAELAALVGVEFARARGEELEEGGEFAGGLFQELPREGLDLEGDEGGAGRKGEERLVGGDDAGVKADFGVGPGGGDEWVCGRGGGGGLVLR